MTAALLSLAFVVAAAGGATCGTLKHGVTLRAGQISTYQIITPTTANASPRDLHRPGHFKHSPLGLPAEESHGLGVVDLAVRPHLHGGSPAVAVYRANTRGHAQDLQVHPQQARE